MTPAPAQLTVLALDRFACIRIVGRATLNSSVDLSALLNELSQNGFRRFVFDLSECTLMDSTILGLLAGFGLKLSQSPAKSGMETPELLNPNERVRELLESLGVLSMFKVITGEIPLPDGVQAQLHAPLSPSREEVTRACLQAHKTLMEINPDNVPRFKDVTEFLARDLQKVKTAPGEKK
jgi:anti-anti-sigma regulatory factor